MLNLKSKIGLALFGALAISFAGCIVSGTFVIDETFKMSETDQFYSYRVDLTTDPIWIEHKDNIQMIEAVGFVLYIESSENADLSLYVYKTTGAAPNPTEKPDSAVVIIDNLAVASGPQVITYAQSLAAITNLDYLKKLVFSGQFDFYALSNISDGETFKIDSATIIVTLGAG